MFLPPTSGKKRRPTLKPVKTNKWVEIRSSYYFFPKGRPGKIIFLLHHCFIMMGGSDLFRAPQFFWRVCKANLYFCRHICLFLVSLSQKWRSRGVLLFYQ